VVDDVDGLEDGDGTPLEENIYEGIKIEGRLSLSAGCGQF
jgi:hypothetical protein